MTTSDGLDMPWVIDQLSGYAADCERSGPSMRQHAQGWRDKRWSRLDQEIEWAKARKWTKGGDTK
jgi:hypothetical protein